MPITTLEQSIDPTGAQSNLELQQQDISNLIDNYNQLQNQLNGGNITQNEQNLIVFDNTTNRVLIGYQTVLQTWGMFVSQPGVDVTQATASQLIFNSNQDVFKVVASGTLTIPSPGAQTSFADGVSVASIAHGLGYVPAFLYFPIAPGNVYFNGVLIGNGLYLSGNNSWSDNTGVGAQAQNFYDIGGAVNSTTLFLYNTWSTGDGNSTPLAVQVKYYLLQESIVPS